MIRSPFRPQAVPDAGILDNHRALVRQVTRRGMFRRGISLGALTMLTGCNLSDDASVDAALRAVSAFNDKVQALLFDPNKLAPTYPESMVLKPPRFNAYYPIDKVRPVDGATWKLEVSGRVSDRAPWTTARLAALPQTDMVIRHVCVEGWDYIGEWSGPTLKSFLHSVGADLNARYVAFHTADDYPSSIDMATALHPQTLLALTYARETLPDPYGYPVRLRTSTKLGYKNPKWITAIEVTNDYPGGFWEKSGFGWFAGI
ncbi:MAG: molybdopterin-dependent oxidoreductase [Proteobacteria bacterium]|nr:molybdopterin-dependent oxidoreductase [Pseudomonadota bacterium]